MKNTPWLPILVTLLTLIGCGSDDPTPGEPDVPFARDVPTFEIGDSLIPDAAVDAVEVGDASPDTEADTAPQISQVPPKLRPKNDLESPTRGPGWRSICLPLSSPALRRGLHLETRCAERAGVERHPDRRQGSEVGDRHEPRNRMLELAAVIGRTAHQDLDVALGLARILFAHP